jgi:translation initiation factor IF-3
VEIKEVRMSLNIDTHDFETKVSHAERFAKSGDKIKVSIRFKGREMGHPEIGYSLMRKFAESCEQFADIERSAKLDGRNMLMFLAPKPKSK